MASRSHRFLGRLLVLLALGVAACAGEEQYPQTTFEPVTEYGRISDSLFTSVFWWMMLVLVVVFVFLGFILWKYRERPDSPEPRPIYGNTVLEILWTVGPAVIIVLMAVPTIRAIFETQRPAPEDALVVEAIGHQWWWEFRYPEQGIVTAGQMVVPTGTPLDIRLSSADVIHSFWFPRLGGKRDANPVPRVPEGQRPRHQNHISITIEEPGEYLGQCAEYCGTSHAVMRMLAVAVEPAAFEDWVAGMRRDTVTTAGPALRSETAPLVARGREVFMRSSCIACHAIEGTNARGVIGPNLTAFGDRWSIGSGMMDNTGANLFEWIKRAPEIKKGVIMPGSDQGAGGMPPTNLSDEEIRAVAAYLSSLGAGLPAETDGGAPGTE